LRPTCERASLEGEHDRGVDRDRGQEPADEEPAEDPDRAARVERDHDDDQQQGPEGRREAEEDDLEDVEEHEGPSMNVQQADGWLTRLGGPWLDSPSDAGRNADRGRRLPGA